MVAVYLLGIGLSKTFAWGRLMSEARERNEATELAEAGGACEIGGRPWIFLDLSLSIEEQLGQVEDALRYFIEQDFAA